MPVSYTGRGSINQLNTKVMFLSICFLGFIAACLVSLVFNQTKELHELYKNDEL